MRLTAVILFGAPVGAGVLVGYLCGGRLSGLSAVRLRRLWLLWLAAALQILQLTTTQVWPAGLGGPARVALLAGTFVTGLAWLALNTPDRPGVMQFAVWTIAAGGILNGVAVAANGRMPYNRSAAATAGLRPGTLTAKNIAAGAHTRVPALGDIIPVAAVHAVLSVGDLLIIAGVIGLIASAMGQGRPGRRGQSRNDTRLRPLTPTENPT